VTVSLKYAHVERERRWLLSTAPEVDGPPAAITDRYLRGTRMRLRELVEGGKVVRKLGHKVRPHDGPDEVACTNFYLDDAEWAALARLPADVLHKQRWRVVRQNQRVVLDVFAGHLTGLVLVEVDRGTGPDLGLPSGFEVVAEVTREEAFTGAALARCDRAAIAAATAAYGVRLPD
jgi:hypothetical protein